MQGNENKEILNQSEKSGPSPKIKPKAPNKKSPNDFYFGRVIGEGSFSTVYLAKDSGNKKEVAIKMCRKDLITREKKQQAIMREKEILCILGSKWSEKSPYFVRLYATMQDGLNLYFVLTYAKNGDMFRFIKKMAQKHVDVTQFYAAELVQAVEHLHRLSIIHRDLKPENILLSGSMHILLTDFGSAKIVSEKTDVSAPDSEESSTTVPKRSSFVGTAQYVSPEILTNRGSFPASDLWAIGCILYQMMSGVPPFQSQSEYLIFQKIQKLDFSFHEGFNSEARDLVKKLITLEPSERLGANDKDGYVSIKNHPFFKDINFDVLYKSSPPQIESYLNTSSSEEEDAVWTRHPDMRTGLDKESINRILKDQIEGNSDSAEESSDDQVGEAVDEVDSLEVNLRVADIADQERTKLLEQQEKNNEFHKFVEGNLILKQGFLDKKKGLWSRKRMFLLTEGPRLFYVDAREMVLKGEIPWSADMKTEMKNFKIFFIHTPNRIYYLIDNTSFASKWCEAIESVKNFYFPPSS